MEDQKFAKRAKAGLNGAASFRAFNAEEANRVLSERWRQISSRAADLNVPSEERPQTYKASPSSGSAWGKPSLHLQARIDFLGEVKTAIARGEGKK